MKKLLSLILVTCIVFSCLIFTGCETPYTDPTENIEVTQSKDKYRNYYEIFVGSFCDSDGDGVGDLQGIISKLDYLNDGDPTTDDDLGIDGIWLTPIMPSQSYHKYDVIDYFDIDEYFGTLDDFDELVNECHKRGINIIIDMVLNHCSKFMPMFENACKEALAGNLQGDARYFEIEKYDSNPGTTHTYIGNDYYYESNFSPYMPEWDLSADCTREYFLDIAKFWLKDHNVDGFRLDACRYYESKNTKAKEFLSWYYDAVSKIDPDVYMVGEHWMNNSDIQDLYESKIDSLFAFGFAGSSGIFVNSLRLRNINGIISQVERYEKATKKSNENAINCYFLSNHDQMRSGTYLRGGNANATKMAASIYMLMPGNSYMYYGEEIGMTQDAEQDKDEYKRCPMVWDSKNLPDIYVNGVVGSDKSQVPYGGVKQQQSEENSLLNFYKRIIKIKNQNPEIARGTISKKLDFDDSLVGGYIVEYKGSKVMIVHNISDTEVKEVTISEDIIANPTLRGDLVASDGTNSQGDSVDEHISLSGTTLKLPPQSTAILKSAE